MENLDRTRTPDTTCTTLHAHMLPTSFHPLHSIARTAGIFLICRSQSVEEEEEVEDGGERKEAVAAVVIIRSLGLLY